MLRTNRITHPTSPYWYHVRTKECNRWLRRLVCVGLETLVDHGDRGNLPLSAGHRPKVSDTTYHDPSVCVWGRLSCGSKACSLEADEDTSSEEYDHSRDDLLTSLAQKRAHVDQGHVPVDTKANQLAASKHATHSFFRHEKAWSLHQPFAHFFASRISEKDVLEVDVQHNTYGAITLALAQAFAAWLG